MAVSKDISETRAQMKYDSEVARATEALLLGAQACGGSNACRFGGQDLLHVLAVVLRKNNTDFRTLVRYILAQCRLSGGDACPVVRMSHPKSDLPSHHRALVLDAVGADFKVKERATPQAGPGSVVVQVLEAPVLSYQREI